MDEQTNNLPPSPSPETPIKHKSIFTTKTSLIVALLMLIVIVIISVYFQINPTKNQNNVSQVKPTPFEKRTIEIKKFNTSPPNFRINYFI